MSSCSFETIFLFLARILFSAFLCFEHGSIIKPEYPAATSCFIGNWKAIEFIFCLPYSPEQRTASQTADPLMVMAMGRRMNRRLTVFRSYAFLRPVVAPILLALKVRKSSLLLVLRFNILSGHYSQIILKFIWEICQKMGFLLLRIFGMCLLDSKSF